LVVGRTRTIAGRAAGFTLLELLVSLTLLSLVGLIMLGGLRLGGRVWERGAVAGDAVESVAAPQNLLRRQLANIYPLWQVSSPTQGQVAFEGTRNSLTFVAPIPAQLGPAPNQRFRLEITSAGELELGWHGLDDSGGTDSVRSTLLAKVAGLELAYFGPDQSGRNPQWWDSWSGRRQPPELIRIRVRFPLGDRRLWPELVVHPEIMVDVACVYDPIYRGCRGR